MRRAPGGIGRLAVAALVALSHTALADKPAGLDWPQWRGALRDGVWRETGIVEKFASAEIKAKWRAPVSNGYSGPTVADGRVYITDRVKEPAHQERVHCFDWETGKPLWSHAYDCLYKGISYPNGPRASVTVHEGLAYSLGTMGHLLCLDAATGKVLWKHECYEKYQIRMPDWGIAAAPIIEGDKAIVMIGGKDACLVAFDRKTGEERWRALSDRASYSAPVLIEQGGKPVLVAWTGERVAGLNPQDGKLLWEAPFPAGQIVDGVSTPAVDGDRLFVSSVYEGSLMLKLGRDKATVEKVWQKKGADGRDTDPIHSLIPTPILSDGHIYGIDYNGELRCVDGKTGQRVWEETSVVPKAMWATAHLIRNGDRALLFNEKGELIVAKLSPKGYSELSRARLIAPTRGQLNQRGGVAWSHPAFAYGHVFARNDEELICADLRAR